MDMEEGQCIYELVLDDEQIDSLIIALNEFKRSKNEFEFEVSDDTSIAFYHIDSEPKDDDGDDESEDDDGDDEGDWIDNKSVVVSTVQVMDMEDDEEDDEWEDDEGNDDENEEVVE